MNFCVAESWPINGACSFNFVCLGVMLFNFMRRGTAIIRKTPMNDVWQPRNQPPSQADNFDLKIGYRDAKWPMVVLVLGFISVCWALLRQRSGSQR